MADPDDWPLPPSNIYTAMFFAHPASNGTSTVSFQLRGDRLASFEVSIALASIIYGFGFARLLHGVGYIFSKVCYYGHCLEGS